MNLKLKCRLSQSFEEFQSILGEGKPGSKVPQCPQNGHKHVKNLTANAARSLTRVWPFCEQ